MQGLSIHPQKPQEENKLAEESIKQKSESVESSHLEHKSNTESGSLQLSVPTEGFDNSTRKRRINFGFELGEGLTSHYLRHEGIDLLAQNEENNSSREQLHQEESKEERVKDKPIKYNEKEKVIRRIDDIDEEYEDESKEEVVGDSKYIQKKSLRKSFQQEAGDGLNLRM